MEKVKVITTARALIFNTKNELLLVKNDENSPWFTPGGWLDGFEKLEETCAREVLEETGIEVEPIKLLKIDYHQLTIKQNIKWKENINKVEHYFLCKIIKGEPKIGEGNLNIWSDKDSGNTKFIKFFSEEEAI